MNQVEIYTDGACKGNPGPGGWGVFLKWGTVEKELFGGELGTTNNRMEMMAVIQGLSALKQPCEITLYLDSQYVLKGITEWLPGWKARGWRTASKEPVKNVELWQQLDKLVAGGGHKIDWRWVRGHNGNPGNERADMLANRGVDVAPGPALNMDNAAPVAAPAQTFLWHDYETFGAQVRRDRPAQFAAIRTDAELNEIGEPIMLYCRPAPDFLPDPVSCLITGITPQTCLAQGIPEHEFAAQIAGALGTPGTIGVGYNTIRFDDEITRFMLWRNLIDPYAREWQNHCGRWDLLDVVRTAHALRPEGIEWPKNAEGGVSFRLEHLSAANGLVHDAAHDALSDVRATIALARLIRTAQPRLFDFCFALHKKERVAAELGLPTTLQTARPFLHISGMFGVERGCLALMWPLAMHPTNRNELIAWDLAHDPTELGTMRAEDIRLRLFNKADALPEGVTRLPVKTIHLNKSPMVVARLKTLSPAMAERWGLDMQAQLRHGQLAAALPDMSAIWPEVFHRPAPEARVDIDEDLYGGFPSQDDRRRLEGLRALAPEPLAAARTSFDDPRLEELVFRYRARNFPATLSSEEQVRWLEHRAARLFDGADGARTIDAFFAQIDELSETADERGEEILGALYDYAEAIAPERD